MRPTIFDTPFVQARDVKRYIPEAAAFMVKNPSTVLTPDRIKEIEAQRIFSSTPVSRIFKSFASTGKLNNFLYLDFSDIKYTAIPEVLVSDDLCIDGLTAGPSVPAFAKKCWINLTPILGKKDAYNDKIYFTDQTALAFDITRAALITAYTDKDLWLTIKQALFVIELYSTIIAQTISNTYTLDPAERKLIMTLFALYYAQLISPSNSDQKLPPMIMRCPFLGSGADIMGIAELASEYARPEADGRLSLFGITKCIQDHGPARMKNYSIQMLYRSLSASSIDSSTMVIALDYPPYWVYQMLRVASGYKNPIISGIVKTLGLKNKLQGWADDVADNQNLIGAVDRC